MKKKLALLPVIGMVLSMLLLAGCGSDSAAGKDDSIITIQKSDEAEEYEKNVLTKNGGDRVFLQEGNYDNVIAGFNASPRKEQSFPQCDVKNELDCMEFEGSRVYTLTPDNYENIILYTHGGGWVFEIAKEHVEFCDILAARLNAKVYMPLYPLAPEADSTETYAVIEDLYKELLKEGKKIYIMGDSAGGNITLGLMYTIKEEGLTPPAKMVLISPCSDMTFSNAEIKELEARDPVLAIYGAAEGAKIWAGEENLKNPKYSAVYADVSGYPDTMIFAGTNDILTPDNLILYENMKAAGVNVTLVKGEDLWHVFPTDSIPEREESIGLIEKFCAD